MRLAGISNTAVAYAWSMPISVTSSSDAPSLSKSVSVGIARPEASTTKSAEMACDVPSSASYETARASRRSADGATSVTRDRRRNSTLGSSRSRRRQMFSSKGRERKKASKPRSRCGNGSNPGCSYRMARPARPLMAPAFRKFASRCRGTKPRALSSLRQEAHARAALAAFRGGHRVPPAARPGRAPVTSVEIGRDRFRGGEAAHPRSDDDGMFGDGWHRWFSDEF